MISGEQIFFQQKWKCDYNGEAFLSAKRNKHPSWNSNPSKWVLAFSKTKPKTNGWTATLIVFAIIQLGLREFEKVIC